MTAAPAFPTCACEGCNAVLDELREQSCGLCTNCTIGGCGHVGDPFRGTP